MPNKSIFYKKLNRYCETNQWIEKYIVPDYHYISDYKGICLDTLKYLTRVKDHCVELLKSGYNDEINENF